MKKLVTFTAILALAVAVRAQGPSKEAPKSGPDKHGPAMQGDHEAGPVQMGAGPEEGAKGPQEEMGLSEEQSKKLRTLREGQRAGMRKMRLKLRELMAKLQHQVDDKAADSAINATLKEFKAAKKDMERAHEKLESASDAILTPTQRAKMALKMKGRPGMGMGMGMGMGPGMMGGPAGPGGPGKADDHDAGKGRGHYND